MLIVVLLTALAHADIAPPRIEVPCEPERRCFGLERTTCDPVRDGRDCLRLARMGWRAECGRPGPGSLWCRRVVEPVEIPVPDPAALAALGDAPPLAVRLAGSVQARVAADAPAVLLGPYPDEGSEPIIAVQLDDALRVRVGTDPLLLLGVPATAAVPVLARQVVAHGSPDDAVHLILRPGARFARLTEGDAPRIRALGPVEVDVEVPSDALGLTFAPPVRGQPGDRCAAVGAVLRDEAGEEIGRVAGVPPCVGGFRLVEERGDQALVALSTDEVELRAFIAESDLTAPIPGLRTSVGLGSIGGGGSGSSADIWRKIPAGSLLYDAPSGRVVGRAVAERPVHALEGRADGWWRAVVYTGIGQASAWIAPDPPLAPAVQPEGRDPSPPEAASAVGAPGGCGCVAGGASPGVSLGWIALVLVALGRRRPALAPHRR